MNITNKTVLITGGGSGIGFEIARQLIEKGNEVIITSRNETKLKKAADQLKGLHYFAADITDEADIDQLVGHVKKQFKKLDLLINNAAGAYAYELSVAPGDFDRSLFEINTNYLAVVRLVEKFLPLLNESREAAIVNVSSIVAFTASNRIPTYAASKAALHFYTQSLRHALQKTGAIKVFELMPPLVDTELSKEIDGHNGIPPKQVAKELLDALQADEFEIHVGQTAEFYNAFHTGHAQAYKTLNGIAN